MLLNAFNAFNAPRLNMLTGEINPIHQTKPSWKDTQLLNLAAKDRKALALKSNPSAYISIGTQADADRRGAMRKAAI